MTLSQISILDEFSRLVSHWNHVPERKTVSESTPSNTNHEKKPKKFSRSMINLLDTLFEQSTDHLETSCARSEAWYPTVMEAYWNLLYLLYQQRRFDEATKFQGLIQQIRLLEPERISDGELGVLLILFRLSNPTKSKPRLRSLLESTHSHTSTDLFEEWEHVDVTDSIHIIPNVLQHRPFNVTFSPSRTFSSNLEDEIHEYGNQLLQEHQNSWFPSLQSSSFMNPNFNEWLPARLSKSTNAKKRVSPKDTDSAYGSITESPSFDIYDWSETIGITEKRHVLQWEDLDSNQTEKLPLDLVSPFLSEQTDDIFHAVYVDAKALDISSLFVVSESDFIEALFYVAVGLPSRVFLTDQINATCTLRVPDTLTVSYTTTTLQSAIAPITSAGATFLSLKNFVSLWRSNTEQFKSTGLALADALDEWLDYLRSCIFQLVDEHRTSTPFSVLEAIHCLDTIIQSLESVANAFSYQTPLEVIDHLFRKLQSWHSEWNMSHELLDEFQASIELVFTILLRRGCRPLLHFTDSVLGLASQSSSKNIHTNSNVLDGYTLTAHVLKEIDPIYEFWHPNSEHLASSDTSLTLPWQILQTCPSMLRGEGLELLHQCIHSRLILNLFQESSSAAGDVSSRHATVMWPGCDLESKLIVSDREFSELSISLQKFSNNRIDAFWAWRKFLRDETIARRKRIQDSRRQRVQGLEVIQQERDAKLREETRKMEEKSEQVKLAIQTFLDAHKQAKQRQIEQTLEEEQKFLEQQNERERLESEIKEKEAAALEADHDVKLDALVKLEQRLAWRTRRFHFYTQRKELLASLMDTAFWSDSSNSFGESLDDSSKITPVAEATISPANEQLEFDRQVVLDNAMCDSENEAEASSISTDTSVYESALEDLETASMDLSQNVSNKNDGRADHDTDENSTQVDVISQDLRTEMSIADELVENRAESLRESEPMDALQTIEIKEVGTQARCPSPVHQVHPWKPTLSILSEKYSTEKEADNSNSFEQEMDGLLQERVQELPGIRNPNQLSTYITTLWKAQTLFLSRLVCSLLFADGDIRNAFVSPYDIRFHFKLLASRFCIADGVFASFLSDHLFRADEHDHDGFMSSASLNLNGRQKAWPPTLEELSMCLKRIPLDTDGSEQIESAFLEWNLGSFNPKIRGTWTSLPIDTSALNMVNLVYTPPKQFSFIFNASTLRVYHESFHFLLNVLRADEALNRITLSDLWHIQRPQVAHESPQSPNEMRLLIQFVHHARVVVKGLLSYFYDIAIQNPTKEFLDHLNTIGKAFDPQSSDTSTQGAQENDLPSVDDVVQCHHRFQSQMKHRLFLEPGQRFIHEQLNSILAIVIRLSYHAQGLVRVESLLSMFAKFKERYELLVAAARNSIEKDGGDIMDIFLLHINPSSGCIGSL